MADKLTKARLEDMSIDELQRLANSKEVSKAELVAKLAPKAK